MFSKISLLLVVVLSIGCATSSKSSRASEEEILEQAKSQETPDAREYTALVSQYRKKNYDIALKRARVFIKTYPRSVYLDQTTHLQALSCIALKQYSTAIVSLEKTLEITQNEKLQMIATYNLAFVYFELQDYEKAYITIEKVTTLILDISHRAKFYILKAKLEKQKQNYERSLESILYALENTSAQQKKTTTNALLAFLSETLEFINNVSFLEKLQESFEQSLATDNLLYKIGKLYIQQGNRNQAKYYFEKLVKNHPKSSFFLSAMENIRKIQFYGVVDPKRVGVILTLSGKFSKVGYRALQSIALAFNIFKPSSSERTQDNPLSLIVMDDQNDVDRTLSIMDELFYKHHVCAILGPISSKLVVPMGKKAHELGIPLLTLAQQEALASSFVFNTGLSPAIQIHALVSYVRKNLPLNNFAILTPASKFGEEYSKVFWDELDRAGGVVRGYETYTADETDFRSNIDKLIGLASPDARSIELEELEQLKNSMPVKNRSKKWEKMFQLKPIVDFEAVFIPEEPKTLGQILPTFAYRDVEKIVFLGINTWNSPELLTRAGGFAEGSVFVDGFFAASTKPSIKKFVQEYQKTFGSEPALVEQVAYDASNILATILSSGAIASREELQDKLTHLHSFPGISGNISFQNGRFIKFIHLLTVKKNKIEEIVF